VITSLKIYKKKSVKESNNKLLFLTDFELLLTNLFLILESKISALIYAQNFIFYNFCTIIISLFWINVKNKNPGERLLMQSRSSNVDWVKGSPLHGITLVMRKRALPYFVLGVIKTTDLTI